jgi:Peptidase M15
MASFKKVFICFVVILISGCSGMERSEQEKLRRLNAKSEFIHRNHDEYAYPLSTPEHNIREKYPWEMAYIGKYPRITKEYFRCKGSSINPPHIDHKDPSRPANYFDCGGSQKHSMPLKRDQEYIYPILIDLLNYLQAKTGSKVVITCGHRCPVHNAYADNSAYNQNSKHMIGAEVDFYVQGMENRPLDVIAILMGYYQEMPLYKGDKNYREFERLEQGKLNVATPPWYNKEIFIKLYKKDEGRDFDNRHPYPYVSVQVRFDRQAGEKVLCSWQKAFNGYRRF